jgi:transcriptional regulator with XRE-family HTH domain
MEHVLTLSPSELTDGGLTDADVLCDLLLSQAGGDEPGNLVLEVDVHDDRICLKGLPSQAQRATPTGFNQCMSELKDRLREAREAAGLTQAQLGELVGVGQGQISKLERGERKKSTNLVEMAQACGVSPAWLATGKGSKSMGAVAPTLTMVSERRDKRVDELLSLYSSLGDEGRGFILAFLRSVARRRLTVPVEPSEEKPATGKGDELPSTLGGQQDGGRTSTKERPRRRSSDNGG